MALKSRTQHGRHAYLKLLNLINTSITIIQSITSNDPKFSLNKQSRWSSNLNKQL